MRKGLCLMVILAFMALGCASTNWQTKSTTTMLAGKAAIAPVQSSFQPACNVATFPPDKCGQLKKLYNDTRSSWIAGKNALVLAMTAVDAQQSDNLMAQWPILWEKFSALTAEMIALIQQIEADKTGTRMPQLPAKKAKLTGVEISLIVTILTAIVQAIPNIWAAWQAGQINQTDIQVLITQLNTAEAQLPAWI